MGDDLIHGRAGFLFLPRALALNSQFLFETLLIFGFGS
jgi:hypothetical protein